MFDAAIVAAFKVDKSYWEIEFVRQEANEFLVGPPLGRRCVQCDDKSVVVEFGHDLGLFGIRFYMHDEDHIRHHPETKVEGLAAHYNNVGRPSPSSNSGRFIYGTFSKA